MLDNCGTQVALDLQSVQVEGTAWFVRQQLSKDLIPLPSTRTSHTCASAQGDHGERTAVCTRCPILTGPQIEKYSDAYFNSFNLRFPILDKKDFMTETANRVLREGYREGDSGAVLALMVFALGQVESRAGPTIQSASSMDRKADFAVARIKSHLG